MNCPVCHSDLRAGEREGVELDYCPHCYGVWLDHGEFEQIIERSKPVDWDWHRNDDAGDPRSYSDVKW